MGMVTRGEKYIVGVMFVVQAILLFAAEPIIATLLPPLLAAAPTAYATLRSEQTVENMKPGLRRACISISILSLAVIAFFVLPRDDLSFKSLILRALLTDIAVLWLAAVVAVHFQGYVKARAGI